MTLVELLLLGVAAAGLTGMGVVLGATVMWRLVHRTEPPPLPLWVSIAGGVSAFLIVLPTAIAGRPAEALAFMVGLSLAFVAQAYARIRLRARSA